MLGFISHYECHDHDAGDLHPDAPVRLDNTKLVAWLGEEPHTPLDDALRTTLLGMDCLGKDVFPLQPGKIMLHSGA